MSVDPRKALTDRLADVDVRLALVVPPQRATGDPGDLRALGLEHDLSIDGRARLTRMRRELVEAIARVNSGAYGRCLDCSAAIPAPRLRTRPEAETCVPCESRRERTRSAFTGPERVRLREYPTR